MSPSSISPAACSTRSASACMIASMMPLLSLIEANRDVLDLYSITSSARPSSVGGIGSELLRGLDVCDHAASSSSNAFASFRSLVSKPSVNQP
jgi:hypothetical protein